MLKLVLNKLGFKRLEPYDGKLSSTVLRGRRKWQHFLCYPTLSLMSLFSFNTKVSSFNTRFSSFNSMRFIRLIQGFLVLIQGFLV